jgi:hypothetical protein
MAIRPTKVDPDDWWKMEPVELDTIRPKPNRDVLLVCGDGACVFDDIAAFLDLDPAPFDTMLINHMPLAYPGRYEHFVCGDSHMKPMQKIALTLPADVRKHCWNPGSTGFDIRWVKEDGRGWNGTTAALAVKIGITLDYLRIVLAGCPMDHSGHWYDKYLNGTDKKLQNDHRHHLWYWTELATRPIGRFVRSMSGNTADLLGLPDADWTACTKYPE